MNIKNKNEILNKLEIMKDKNNYNNSDITFLEELIQIGDTEIRYEVAEVLSGKNEIEINKIFLELLNDENELVRINASDSVYNCTSNQIIDKLKDIILNDKYLVRGYAILSICDIANKCERKEEILNFIESRLKVEKSKWVKATIYSSLYLLNNENKYIILLLNLLDESNYKIRCMVLNRISELLNKKNYLIVKEKLENRMKVEDSVAVRSSIINILNKNQNKKKEELF